MKPVITYIICMLFAGFWLFYGEDLLLDMMQYLGMKRWKAENNSTVIFILSILFFNLVVLFATQLKKSAKEKAIIYFVSIVFSFVGLIGCFLRILFLLGSGGKVGG